jgi:hypothetical protein
MRIIINVFFIFCFIVACRESYQGPEPLTDEAKFYANLAGNWQWSETKGGIAGMDIKADSSDYGMVYNF